MSYCICRREMAMQQGIQTAVDIPMSVARHANALWPTLKELAAIVNINCRSDLQVKRIFLLLTIQIHWIVYVVLYGLYSEKSKWQCRYKLDHRAGFKTWW